MTLFSGARIRARTEDEACEFVAIATLAASEAGAPPASVFQMALEIAALRFAETIERLASLNRRLRFAPGRHQAIVASVGEGRWAELVEEIVQAEQNGDDLRQRMEIYLQNSFERRDLELRERIEIYPTYMIIVLVLFFMPAILIVLVGPAFLALLRALYDV